MAIISTNRLPQHEMEAGIDGNRTYRQTWQVIVDDARYDGVEVLLAAPTPDYGAAYVGPSGSFDTYALLVKKNIRRDTESRFRFFVDCEYTTSPSQFEYTDNPLNKPAEYEWDFGSIERVITRDADGKKIQNSAGDPFNPQPTFDEPILILNYAKNVAFSSYNPVTAAGYCNAVNTDSFLGFPAGSCRCSYWKAKLQYTKTFPYWASEIQVQIREDKWELELLDQGLNYKKGDFKGPIKLPENEGDTIGTVPVTEPQLLNGSGDILAAGGAPVYLKFKPYRLKPFSALGITYANFGYG